MKGPFGIIWDSSIKDSKNLFPIFIYFWNENSHAPDLVLAHVLDIQAHKSAEAQANFLAWFVLQHLGLPPENWTSCTCDNTSVNSGLKGGIVKILNEKFGLKIARIPCCLHIMDLCCKAFREVFFGPDPVQREDL